MENQHRIISGYRDLSEDELAVFNRIKAHAAEIGRLVDDVAALPTATGSSTVDPPAGTPMVDPRWCAIARTHLQQGFMALGRSVARPESF